MSRHASSLLKGSSMKVQIIGAGQLGSRHLQALRNTNFKLDITVIDPSSDSLKVAKERYESLPEKGIHSISYSEVLPQKGDWDLIIVATNAVHRKSVLEHAISHFNTKNFIIEKILFTKESDYTWAKQYGDSTLKNAWVNCCMRQMPVYQDIKSKLRGTNFLMNVSGSNYGLVTNAIHYIDYAAWLAQSNDFVIDTSKIQHKVIDSKRKGYLELNGTITAKFANGAVAQFNCFADGSLPICVQVDSPEQRFSVYESERKVLAWDANRQWQREETEAVIPYQSQLTTEIVSNIHDGKEISLPRLNESLATHLNLLKPLKVFLNNLNHNSTEEFPFT